jgi:hypothetical protein
MRGTSSCRRVHDRPEITPSILPPERALRPAPRSASLSRITQWDAGCGRTRCRKRANRHGSTYRIPSRCVPDWVGRLEISSSWRVLAFYGPWPVQARRSRPVDLAPPMHAQAAMSIRYRIASILRLLTTLTKLDSRFRSFERRVDPRWRPMKRRRPARVFAARLHTAPIIWLSKCGRVCIVSEGGLMQRWAVPIKLFAYLVVLLMLAATGYAAFTAVKYWPAISV